MKCKYCGGTVTLEDEFCPYCGALNEPARKHIEDMKRYGEDYERTKAEVLTNAKKQSVKYGKLIIIGVLILANVILIALQFNTYGIADYFEESSVHANAAKYKEALLSYEEEGNYAMLYRYYYANNCYYEDSLDDFQAAADMAMYYKNIVDALYTSYGEAYGYQAYRTESENLQYIASEVYRFYLDYANKDNDYDYLRERYEGTHLAAMEDMDEKIRAMLCAYMNLSQDEAAGLSGMEEADILLLLGRRTGYYE